MAILVLCNASNAIYKRECNAPFSKYQNIIPKTLGGFPNEIKTKNKISYYLLLSYENMITTNSKICTVGELKDFTNRTFME